VFSIQCLVFSGEGSSAASSLATCLIVLCSVEHFIYSDEC
jgi:hypothetical protein